MDFVSTQAGFIDELMKIASTRAVREWRAAAGAGDQATADAIAKGYGDLGLKPRELKGISEGGGEAGVDLMMGRAANPTTGATNESGYVARKLYKPDSTVTRGEFTAPLLQQKQQMTDAARALSPEARAMVPDMYGHQTLHADRGPGMTRNVSYHEYVPNASDIRGRQVTLEDGGGTVWQRRGNPAKDISAIENQVVRPLQAQGMEMKDVLRQAGGTNPNFGNMVATPSGPKVLDFIPETQGQARPHLQSYVKYAPDPSEMQFNQPGALPFLKREVFNPQMRVQEAHPSLQDAARSIMQHQHPGVPGFSQPGVRPTQVSPASAARPVSAPATGSAMTAVAGRPLPAAAARPATPSPSLGFAKTMVSPTTPTAGALHPPHLPTAVGGALGRAEQQAVTSVGGALRRPLGALGRAVTHMH